MTEDIDKSISRLQQEAYNRGRKSMKISPFKLKIHLERIKEKLKTVQEGIEELDLLIKKVDKL